MNNVIVLGNFMRRMNEINEKIMRMTHLTKKRNIDDEGYLMHFNEKCDYSAIIDLHKNALNYSYHYNDMIYTLCFDGELYNISLLKEELTNLGYTLKSKDICEVIILSYIEWNKDCLNHFEGAFSLVIDDGKQLFIARDVMGIKPLFYYIDDKTIVLSDEIKSILAYNNEAIVDETGIKELLGLGPSVTPGRTIYKDIYSLRPAHYMYYNGKIDIQRYWKLEEKDHEDTLKETIDKVKMLVEESTLSNICEEPTTVMLSGGLDSTILTSILSRNIDNLKTFSLSYTDQKEYFKAYDYQTSMDDEYIDDAIHLFNCDHHSIELTQEDLVGGLKDALIARDMPGMADIDASLMLFSKEISKTHTICFSGECSDELFGGYPWFYKEELYNLPHFPWMRDLDYRIDLLHDDIRQLDIKSYIIDRYNETLKEIHTDDRHKQIMYLNMEWFMQTLLSRAYAMTLDTLTVRVPFATKDIAQYLYNMPIKYTMLNNEEKGLLRKAFENDLPKSILHRKKTPFPKTHSPKYKELVSQLLLESFNDDENILFKLFNKDKLYDLTLQKGETMVNPWFGQLMTGPQFLAYLYTIYLWGKIYHIQLQL